jgi:peptidyl-prolyl cis-trans isomerase SurA
MRLITTLSLGAATLAFAGLCADAQPLRTAAADPVVASPSPGGAPAADPAFTPQAATKPTAVATAAPAPDATAPADVKTSDGITATVGENSVSDYELDQRVKLFFATAGFKPTPADIQRARKIQLDQLIDEHIQLAEARKRHITVSPVEVDDIIKEIAAGQHTTVQALTEALAKAGSSINELRKQQIASIAWRKVIGSEFADQVVVTPAMIDDALRRAAEGANKTHYHVMEIFLPVDNPDKDAAVKAQIEDIAAQIHKGAPFRNLAQQFSRNPSAAKGGDMGWVYDGQLDPALNAALAKMTVNEMSPPIRAKGGWYLLGLQERQEALGTNVKAQEPVTPSSPPGTLPLARLLLPMPPGSPENVVKNTMSAAEQIRSATVSCDALQKISENPQLKGSIFMALGVVKLADISEQMRAALATTKSGEVAEPFQSDAGVEIIARCDPRAPPPREAFARPKRSEIEGELFQEQISAMARRYLRDLRRDASIQERNDNAVLDAALVK